MYMNYRLIILFKFYLLFGGILFSATNFAQESDTPLQEKKESVTRVEKTSSNNIHVDEIVIKNSPSSQPGSHGISDSDYQMLITKLSFDVEKEISSWITWKLFLGIIPIFIILVGAFWAFISRTIENTVKEKVNEKIEPHVDRLKDSSKSLDDQRKELIGETVKASTEIKNTRETFEKLKNTGEELENKQKQFQSKIKEEIENKEKEIAELNQKTLDIKNEQKSFNEELKSKTDNEIPLLELKADALKRVINIIDKDGNAKDQVVSKFIELLESDDSDVRDKVAEILPWFKPESSEINKAFLDILKNKNPDKTFRPILLSGLGKLRDDGKTSTYLLTLLDNMNDRDILAVIGALGEIGETSEIGEINITKIPEEEKELIIEKLILVLNDDLDNKEFSKEANINASDVKGAIALALSYYRKKAVSSVRDLIKLLEDQKPETRINAVIALGRIGDKSAIQALEKLKNNEDTWDELKEEALKAIEEISRS
ncbi:HEAT repeat domain-containing protein [Candidatus Methylobacter oryzae]|uniref:HEAT repeat domain-containing protein n=1 Tax=Candidatus Methylobacter oryzae TaxID=2497749 RepID=A0ABY3C840_9GAMM|nr:HEAT repeat domain-containing protein [Candidatus Methylobacter oryzae]TRW92707.1 hypothetical protein EKO24_014870 [Candidatus Methylobacter oryzae]